MPIAALIEVFSDARALAETKGVGSLIWADMSRECRHYTSSELANLDPKKGYLILDDEKPDATGGIGGTLFNIRIATIPEVEFTLPYTKAYVVLLSWVDC